MSVCMCMCVCVRERKREREEKELQEKLGTHVWMCYESTYTIHSAFETVRLDREMFIR